jgi:hypothetical protein
MKYRREIEKETAQKINTNHNEQQGKVTNLIAKIHKVPSRNKVRTQTQNFFTDRLARGLLRHNWQVHNRYNDHFAQRRVTRLRMRERSMLAAAISDQ